MALSTPDLVSIVFDSIGAVLLAALFYYALATLLRMRRGKLEKSWLYISRSVIILSIGVIFFASSLFVPANLMMLVMWTASTFMIVGTLLLLLGFRSHYRVWSGAELSDEKKDRIEPWETYIIMQIPSVAQRAFLVGVFKPLYNVFFAQVILQGGEIPTSQIREFSLQLVLSNYC